MLTKATIKDIQSLQQKKYRNSSGRFVAEGPKLVLELLITGIYEPECIYVVPGIDLNPFEHYGAFIQQVTTQQLAQLSGFQTPNEVVAVFSKVRQLPYPPPTNPSILILDDIQDPGNLGTIIRTADWFGIRTIVCSTETADVFNPKVIQSSMASFSRVDVLYTALPDWVDNQLAWPLVVTSPLGQPPSQKNIPSPCAFVIGNESRGVSSALMDRAKHILSIPGSGTAESLNAATAAGICMYLLFDHRAI
jgi:TrmH family RNA methyltransferase